MPLSAEQLETIRGALGDDGAETFEAIQAAVADGQTSLDSAKGEATKAKRDATAAAKALEQARKDLEGAKAGETEQLAALIAERDAAKAEADATAQKHRNYRIQAALAEKMGISDAKKRADALKLFERPDGVDIDEAGALTGADEALKAFMEDRPYLFATEDGGGTANGGRRKGGDPQPKRGTKADDSVDAKIAQWNERLGYRKTASA